MNESTKPIILLTGPVGAGKSTVARELLAISPGLTSYIEGDKFWSFVEAKGANMGMQKNFRTIMLSMTAAAVPIAVAGYEVILDFSVPHWFLDTFRKIAKVRDVPVDYVVLRPSEAVCAKRAVAREQGAIKDYSPFHDLYVSFDDAENHIIKNDDIDAAKLASIIRTGLASGKWRL